MKRLYSFYTSCIVILSIFTFSACQKVDFPPASVLALSVNGADYQIDLNTSETINLTTLSTKFDAVFQVFNAYEFTHIEINGIAVDEFGMCQVPIKKIDENEKIKITYTSGDRKGNILINTLHEEIPKVQGQGKSTTPGDFYVSFPVCRLILQFDNDGNTLFYRYEPHSLTDPDILNGWWDFKKHTYAGKTYYSYHAHDPKFTHLTFPGYNPGMRVLLDEYYRPIKTIHLEASRDGTVKKGTPVDGHDFYFFSPDHYILSSYLDRVIDGETLSVAYLQEVKNGEVVFDWWSSDHPELLSWRDEHFDADYDCVHFNSIQVLPDGNWLCSFRHICSLLKIDRKDMTGDILWAIRGNTLPEEYSFYGQHYATLHNDNSLTLFDNGNGHSSGQTRILHLNIDPSNGNVISGKNITANDDFYFSQACGSVQLIDGNYIVGWGIPGISDEKKVRIVSEYNSAGEKTFELNYVGDFLPNMIRATYRCVKY